MTFHRRIPDACKSVGKQKPAASDGSLHPVNARPYPGLGYLAHAPAVPTPHSLPASAFHQPLGPARVGQRSRRRILQKISALHESLCMWLQLLGTATRTAYPSATHLLHSNSTYTMMSRDTLHKFHMYPRDDRASKNGFTRSTTGDRLVRYSIRYTTQIIYSFVNGAST